MKPTPHDGPPQNSKITTRNSRLRRRLLAWFDAARRDLPWRRDRDPYRIWVSEVMLQQTTVAAVVPYFERFLRAFPSLRDLAAAAEQDVLRLWEGLGYYRRARDLHRAARQLVTTHGGTIPDDPEALGELPGLGRYTVGAILSQAFDRRLPVLEANSLRVLCRLFGRADDPRRGPARRWLWQAAEDLLPHRRVGDFNQALMELGALVCTPTAPRCEACPLADDCVARRLGRQDEIPAKAPPPAITEVREAAVVVRRGADVLLAQRPESASRWANLWEFPHGPVGDRESHEAAARAGRARRGPRPRAAHAAARRDALPDHDGLFRGGVRRRRVSLGLLPAGALAGAGAAGGLPRQRTPAPAGQRAHRAAAAA